MRFLKWLIGQHDTDQSFTSLDLASSLSGLKSRQEPSTTEEAKEKSNNAKTEFMVMCGSCNGVFDWSTSFYQDVTKGSPFAPSHMPTSYYHPRVFCPLCKDMGYV